MPVSAVLAGQAAVAANAIEKFHCQKRGSMEFPFLNFCPLQPPAVYSPATELGFKLDVTELFDGLCSQRRVPRPRVPPPSIDKMEKVIFPSLCRCAEIEIVVPPAHLLNPGLSSHCKCD